MESTSKLYSNKYYSLNSTCINNFGVCDLPEEEIAFLLNETNQAHLDEFFGDKYGVIV